MSMSQLEKQQSWLRSARKLMNGITGGIKTAYIAKVIKYDKKKHIANIQPLNKFSDGNERSQFLEVPVAENCYILDELLDRFKPDFAAVDKNSKIPAHDGVPAHENTHFIEHYPKKHFMRAGVPVVVVVLDRDTDNWKGGRSVETYMPNSDRKHDANDSIIVGVLGGDAVNG